MGSGIVRLANKGWHTGGLLVAVALVVTVYAPALDSAYRLDDFAWLCLRNTIAAGRSLGWALFSPQAQGTIRPLGERLWFLLASSLFGLNPVPLHAFVLCVQVANVVLMADTGWRLLGSRGSAAVAVILWVINDTLVEPLVWASASNEVFYAFWFLAAFNALLRWISSQKRVWLWVHAFALVFALGTLELAVTFPAIAAAYVILFERRHWKALLPSAGIVALYVAVHFAAVPLPKDGPYRLSLGWETAATFWRYWANVLGPEEYGRIHQVNPAITRLGTALLTAAILLWLGVCARRKRWVPLFCLLWFVVALAPTLPLREHVTPYYAFIPFVGLAWLAGDALASAVSWPGRSIAIACAVLYAVCQTPSTIFVRDWNMERSRDVVKREAQLADAVRKIRRVQPDGAVFLTGLDGEQFWWGLCYGQLTKLGYTDLHILPDAADHGIPIPPKEWCVSEGFQLSPHETQRLLREGRGHLFDTSLSAPKDKTADER